MIDAGADLCHRLLAPRIGYLIGSKGDDGPTMAPVSNVTQVSRNPQIFVVAVSRKWTTYENLLRLEGFTLSVPRVEHADAVWKLASRFSGYIPPNGDKLGASGASLDYSASKYGPILADGTGWCECELFKEAGIGETDHGIFFGRVLRGQFNEEFMNPDGTYHRNSTPLMQVVENAFATSSEYWTIPYLGPH